MKNTSFPTLLIVSIIAFSLISCGGESSSKKSTTPTGGTGGDGTGGDGGTGDPITYTCTDKNYEPVHDVASLKAIGKNVESMAKNYCLAKDIDLAGVTSGFPLGWNTVEADITAFTGNFDGQDNTISNLVINEGTKHNIGLFFRIGSKTTTSEIKNLNLNDFKITGYDAVGALAGWILDDVTISKIKTNNAIITGNTNIGGLIGYVTGNSVIIDSAVIEGAVTGINNVGGVIGSIYGQKLKTIGSATISNSHSTSAVSGSDILGGLVGSVNVDVIVSNSYATGTVTGSGSYIGGLIGFVAGDCMISNSYSTGDVRKQGKALRPDLLEKNSIGGLIGQINTKGVVSNSYAAGIVTATGDKGGLVGMLYDCTADDCSVTNSYFDKSTNSGINAIGVTTGIGNPTIIGLVGVNGASDIGVVAGGGFQTIASPNDKIFVGWDATIWQIMAGAWPTFKP